MSTTVAYKGNVIHTAEGSTSFTLNTQGNYLDGDVEVVVSESGGSAELITKSITANGTYNASDDDVDGYSSVTVNVAGEISKVYLYEFNESQGGRWINTEVSVSNIETLCFDDIRSDNLQKSTIIDVANIAVYTGGTDVYTMIYTQTKPMNARIYNGNLWVSYNGTGAATNVTKIYKIR